MIEAYHGMHTPRYIDCAFADDLLLYVPFTINTATGDVVKVIYINMALVNSFISRNNIPSTTHIS